mmetsp:Transcript_31358/g.67415  ORF Transcript_31358/g.67415 Transcript_31358/m.67415 type:complete len:224 (+) Transcript_31358:290-961(+)
MPSAISAATSLSLSLLVALRPEHAAGNSLYLAALCRNVACHQADRPLLGYDEDTESCVCKPHPCWDDGGHTHHCLKPDFPYLDFHFTEEGELVCTCSSIPNYNSVHIARDKCPGHRCVEPEFPTLDWDDDAQECLCRAHPCWNDKGQKHDCSLPEFPILRYREEVDDEDQVKPVCECFMKLDKEGTIKGGSNFGDDDEEEFGHDSDEFAEDFPPDAVEEDEDL